MDVLARITFTCISSDGWYNRQGRTSNPFHGFKYLAWQSGLVRVLFRVANDARKQGLGTNYESAGACVAYSHHCHRKDGRSFPSRLARMGPGLHEPAFEGGRSDSHPGRQPSDLALVRPEHRATAQHDRI